MENVKLKGFENLTIVLDDTIEEDTFEIREK